MAAAAAHAVAVGDTYDQVVAEKGAPPGISIAGSVRILTYPDAIIRVKGGVVVSVRAPDKPADAPAGAAAAPYDGPAVWETDAGAAMAQARARTCSVLILFTGSDWCPWCKKMDAEVYSQPEFARFAHEKLVLLKLDYPRHTPQPDAIKAQNAEMRGRYGVSAFPTALVVDADGKVLARIKGYQPGGPARFIQMLRPAD